MLNYYFYTGYTQDGNFKFGFKRDFDLKNLKIELREKNIFIKKVYTLPFFSKKEKSEDIIILFSQAKMFVKNGYSFEKIFEILSENKNLKIYIDKMKNSLEKGDGLYEIFKNSGLDLKNSECMLIKSGEKSGNIYKAFDDIENEIKNRENLKKDIIKIMIYPLIVLIMVIFLVVFMGVYILPDFIKIIKETSQELPFITKMIIKFVDNFYFIFFLLLLIFFICKSLLKNIKIREKIFQKLMLIKSFRYFQNIVFVSNFTRILEVLLSSGITIIEAINLVKDETKHIYFKKKLEIVEENLKRGKTIGDSFEKISIFSKIDLELIKSGEEAGELVETFSIVALKNKEKLKEKMELGIKILEPVTIIIIGIITGGVFLGMYLPIFQMMDNI